MSSSDKPSVVYGLGMSQVEKAAGHSLEEGKKLREQDPNITQVKGPDEETITPGNWPKTGRLRPLPEDEAARQKYLEQEARRRGEEYDELEAETKGGLPTHDSELYETERRALAEGDLRLKAGEQGFKHPHGPAVRALNKLEGRSEI